VRKYKTIGPLLGKVEGIVENTTTLRSPRMKGYYKFWERRFFNALNKVSRVNDVRVQVLIVTSFTDGVGELEHLPQIDELVKYSKRKSAFSDI
jgi:hypothetical protein